MLDLFPRQVRAWSQRNDRFDGVSQDRIWNTQDYRLCDVFKAIENLFDLPRTYLFASGLDDVILSRYEIQESFTVGTKQVTGVENPLPRIRSHFQPFLCFLRIIPITTHY